MGVIMRNGVMYGADNYMASLADAYSQSSTYAVNDYVTHNGVLYRCIVAVSTPEVWTSAHWTEETLTDQITAWLNTPLVDNVGY